MEVKAEIRSPPSSERDTTYLQVGADWRVFLGKRWFSLLKRNSPNTPEASLDEI